jgi:hypothetical protein
MPEAAALAVGKTRAEDMRLKKARSLMLWIATYAREQQALTLAVQERPYKVRERDDLILRSV